MALSNSSLLVADNESNTGKKEFLKLKDVSSLGYMGYRSAFREMDDGEKEERILELYEAERGALRSYPASQYLDEKKYQYAGLNQCFDVNQNINAGMSYKILNIQIPYVMERAEYGYIVKSKGKMEIG